MNKKQLKERVIKKFIKKTLAENNKSDKSTPAPSKPEPTKKPEEKPGPAVAPGKPGIGKPKPRRPLGNPEVKPAPKAMTEEEMLKKIVDRFKAKKQMEEEKNISPIKAQKIKKLAANLNKNNPIAGLYGSDEANFTKSLNKPYNPIKKDDMPLDKYLASKSKK